MKELEDDIRKYLTERVWDKLRPSDLAKSISIESAELLELFQWSNPELDVVKKDTKKIKEIKGELADILIYCFDLSVLLNLDTEALVRDKLEKIKRKYPAEVMAQKQGKESGTEDAYWKIKRQHRRKNS